jgi:hypothetical protein
MKTKGVRGMDALRSLKIAGKTAAEATYQSLKKETILG